MDTQGRVQTYAISIRFRNSYLLYISVGESFWALMGRTVMGMSDTWKNVNILKQATRDVAFRSTAPEAARTRQYMLIL